MGMPWRRRRNRFSHNCGEGYYKMLTRSKVRETKKSVTFMDADDGRLFNESQAPRSPAARSLFAMRCILELPNELVTLIMRYFNSKELMLLRCVCQDFAYIIDNNKSIWSNVSYQNMWPSTVAEKKLFMRGMEAENKECLIKLGLAHLYHFNLIAQAEKTKREVHINAFQAAEFFRSLDNSIGSNRPITWLLIRPPWSSSAKLECLKQAIYNQLRKNKASSLTRKTDAVDYNIERIKLALQREGGVTSPPFIRTSTYPHIIYEKLLLQKAHVDNDTGLKLQWLRSLHECALTGHMEASFEIAYHFVTNKYQDFIPHYKATEFCSQLFQKSYSLRNDNLEQSQPKINGVMRCILVDWLGEVAYMKLMTHQVLHAAVHYIDRFLATRVIERTKLQLLGITCLLLSAKSHYDSRHVHILTVRESSWLTDQTYQYEDVVKMLGEVIGAFRGDLWPPTSWDYLNLLLSRTEIENRTQCMAHYVHDMSLQYACFCGYKPSLLACSTLMLVNIILNQDHIWHEYYIALTGYQVHDLVNCAALLYFKCFSSPPIKDDRDLPLESIREEYSSEKNSEVAKTVLVPPPVEIKSRILSCDSMLSCVSQDPLQFDIILPDIDDTLNISTKSIDYDGDCEDDNDLNSDSSSDEESFYVGRSRLSSYRSVDDFSDEDTTMDTEAFSLAALKWNRLPKPVLDGSIDEPVGKDDDSESERTDTSTIIVKFPLDIRANIVMQQENVDKNVRRRRLKRKANTRPEYPRRKRTRSEHTR